MDVHRHEVLTNIESIRHAKFHLDSFTLYAYGLTENSMKYLIESSPQLKSLYFIYTRLNPSHINELCHHKSVKHLTISRLEGNVYESIGSMSLESLGCTDCTLYPTGFIQMISGSPHLKKLCFTRTVMHMDLFQICETHLKDLEELVIDCGSYVAVKSVPFAHFSNLTRLVVTSIGHSSHFECIGNISTLNYLKIGESIPFESFKYIVRGNLINLHTLKFRFCSLTDDHIDLVEKCNLPNITKLNLGHEYNVSAISLITISQLKCKKLSRLELPECSSHIELILILKSLKSITELTIIKNPFTEYLDDISKVQEFCIKLNKKFRFFKYEQEL